ncbi:BTB/POZ domain-containing protein At5g41330-like [Durio zibethinus]|uniref:BTB/POZ domain-containing protein At5g41330-like n=1 Tax=Durio zibethinus TaxID=66656 RepID=A0A6P5ZMG2_DURZI|nr:BTB/POZ domain-containing protein At5g41330-like [Durio zibethinus]
MQAGPKSLLAQLEETTSNRFVDRDPDYFSLFLSLLRSGALPSKVKDFGLRDLIEASRFYGLESLLTNSLTNPSHFDAFALQRWLIVPLNRRDSPSAIATTPFGSLHVSHGSKIASFDWSLTRKSTILTQSTAMDSLLAISSDIVAAVATDISGLHILDLQNGSIKQIWFLVIELISTIDTFYGFKFSAGLGVHGIEGLTMSGNCSDRPCSLILSSQTSLQML